MEETIIHKSQLNRRELWGFSLSGQMWYANMNENLTRDDVTLCHNPINLVKCFVYLKLGLKQVRGIALLLLLFMGFCFLSFFLFSRFLFVCLFFFVCLFLLSQNKIPSYPSRQSSPSITPIVNWGFSTSFLKITPFCSFLCCFFSRFVILYA